MEKCINEYFLINHKPQEVKNFEELYKVKGKCIYEVIRIIDGTPLFLEEHLTRLENSLNLEQEKISFDMKGLTLDIKELININELSMGNIKIVINKENLFVFSIPAFYPEKELYETGVKTILFFGERNNPNAKVIDNSFREKVNEEIKKSDSYEAILVNREGFITEGSKSNIFAVKGNVVYTAPVGEVLPGITRDKVIEACISLGLQVEEKNISYKELKELEGMFISGTSPKVLPINEVEGYVKFTNKSSIITKIKTKFDEIINKNIEKNEGF